MPTQTLTGLESSRGRSSKEQKRKLLLQGRHRLARPSTFPCQPWAWQRRRATTRANLVLQSDKLTKHVWLLYLLSGSATVLTSLPRSDKTTMKRGQRGITQLALQPQLAGRRRVKISLFSPIIKPARRNQMAEKPG